MDDGTGVPLWLRKPPYDQSPLDDLTLKSAEDQIFVLCGGDADSMRTAPWFLEMGLPAPPHRPQVPWRIIIHLWLSLLGVYINVKKRHPPPPQNPTPYCIINMLWKCIIKNKLKWGSGFHPARKNMVVSTCIQPQLVVSKRRLPSIPMFPMDSHHFPPKKNPRKNWAQFRDIPCSHRGLSFGTYGLSLWRAHPHHDHQRDHHFVPWRSVETRKKHGWDDVYHRFQLVIRISFIKPMGRILDWTSGNGRITGFERGYKRYLYILWKL